MSKKAKTQSQHNYTQMTTEELEQLLLWDAAQSTPDQMCAEQLLSAMEEYARRKQDEPHKSPEEAYGDFRRRFSPKAPIGQKKRNIFQTHPVLRPIAAMLVLAMVLCYGTYSARSWGYGGTDRILAPYWDNEYFRFRISAADSRPIPTENNYEACRKQFPTWYPEGYEFYEEGTAPWDPALSFSMEFRKGEDYIGVEICTAKAMSQSYFFKDTRPVEVHVVDGVAYYFYHNLDMLGVVWVVDGYGCSLSGCITVDEALKMIESIDRD